MLTLFRAVVALALFASGVACLCFGAWLTSIFLFCGCYQVVTHHDSGVTYDVNRGDD